MVAVGHRPAPRLSSPAPGRWDGEAPPTAGVPVLRWRWLPWTAPRLRLGPAVRPQTRLEIGLCALFRCRREWPARALAERLARAPAGSDDNLGPLGRDATVVARPLGRGAAWEAVGDWVERGVLVEAPAVGPAPARTRVPVAESPVAAAEPRSWPARSPG
ncbi:MAG TPA: hypothetical protein VK066_28795 [Chloroflexota bacterium]|nr:hypothetical protein [Chloroflexota bacterium]